MYKPVSLPSLPRAQCPAYVVFEDRERRVKKQLCAAPALKNGFCKHHAEVYNLLCELDAIDYAALKINENLRIPRGCATWEEYLSIPPGKERFVQIYNAIQTYKLRHATRTPVVQESAPSDEWLPPKRNVS